MTETTHYYCIVRTDISIADQICQVSHASIEAGKQFQHDEHCNLVLLQAKDGEELLAISTKLLENDVDHFVNVEPDMKDEATCIATAPVTSTQRKLFASMKTWRHRVPESPLFV